MMPRYFFWKVGIRTGFFLVMMIATSLPLGAYVVPVFSLPVLSWAASDIVVVDLDDEPEGKWNVVEVWRGTLGVGAELIPARVEPRREFAGVELPWGERAVLFLIPEGEGLRPPLQQYVTLAGSKMSWRGAGEIMESSMAWIEGGRSTVLHRGEMSGHLVIGPGARLPEMKKQVAANTRLRAPLEEIRAHPDLRVRCEKVIPYLEWSEGDWFDAKNMRHNALGILGTCGENGLVKLEALLNDETCEFSPTSILRSMSSMERRIAGPFLVGVLERQLAYWNVKGANGNQKLHGRRMGAAKAVVNHLGEMQYEGCREVLVQTRAFWSSSPELKDSVDGAARLDLLCSRVLECIGEDGRFIRRFPALPRIKR